MGGLAMVLVGVVGSAWFVWRLGTDADATAARVEREVREQFDRRARTLEQVVTGLVARPELVAALDATDKDARTLFDLVARDAAGQGPDFALTVTAPEGTALAWVGRPQPIPASRLTGGSALFVAPGALGLRLVYVQTVRAPPGTEGAARVLGAVAAEEILSPSDGVDAAAAFPARFDTSLLPVTLVPRFLGGLAERGAEPAVTLLAPSGEPLVGVTIPRAAVHELRVSTMRWLVGLMAMVLAVTCLVAAGVLAWERHRHSGAAYRRFTLAALLLLVAARALLWWAWPPVRAGGSAWSAAVYEGDVLAWLHRSPADLFATAFCLVAGVVLAVDPLRRTRLALGLRRHAPQESRGHAVRFTLAQLGAGSVLALLLAGVSMLVSDTVNHTQVDVLMLAVRPVDPARLLVLLGLIGLCAGAFWGGVLVLRVALLRWRFTSRPWPIRVAWPVALWLLPLALGLLLSPFPSLLSPFSSLPSPPVGALAALAAAAATAALRTVNGIAWFRNGTQARRLLFTYVVLLIPALLLYPLLLHAVDRSRRDLVANRYTPQVLSHPRELLARLNASLEQLDRLDALPRIVSSVPVDSGRVTTDAAFSLWRQTDLARARLTSAVEIYAPDGPLASRFAFNFPEYQATVSEWRGTSCAWDVFAEAAPFGSEERSMLHAERGICERDDRGRMRVSGGGVIIHVMLDYSSLPFLSTQGPYFDLFRTREAAIADDASERDVELVVYGWGQSAIFSSASRVWPLPQAVFERAYRTRESFWDTHQRGDRVHDIHVSNDRHAIYVIGFPRVTAIGHLVRLAEVATLAALATLFLLLVHAVLHRVNRPGPQPAVLLIREVRASFTRKLFLAFVASSVIPVLTLAFLVRTFVASRLRADVEAEATRTASVAQRVIEEALALQQPAFVTATALTDDVMVWISRVIKQDVNIFDGPTLLATSQRDLFASGLLPERTPDTVYRAIALQRLPTFVGEDQIGRLRYLLAAAPIRVGTREAILTVPMALRQREIEEEIAELDRGVNLGVVVFILLGATLGYSISGRIGDPVQRLTRASRRIAAGDLDQRVVARTADELQRLVEAFNSMAEELSRQREQLQRTHRLEAWAEMARQVAHDIKNPLTPIQLSAEHLRRVHRDRGEPLAPVLDACVDTILFQVRMLRQISSEFASFASSPTPRVTRVPVTGLVDEVLSGYRIGLPETIRIEADVAAGLPDVRVDRALLGRAIINVIENALHAMPSGGTLTLRADQSDPGTVRLAITDTGVGMDQHALSRLFEPYFSTKAAGTGLGLSIAKRNLELMGGAIEVQSRKGIGTVVTLAVPAAEES